jgi:glyoxylase-like metal-dependent hydrolase (beta-lactamase superfamily II)
VRDARTGDDHHVFHHDDEFHDNERRDDEFHDDRCDDEFHDDRCDDAMMVWKTEFGRFTIYGIEDGWMLRDPMEFLPDSDPEVWVAHPEFLDEGKIRVSLGCFLVAGPSGLVMVDTGLGPPPDPRMASGKMPEALGTIGIRPDEIDTVIHTHLHVDHIGGNLDDSGRPFFPNARLFVHSAELDYWLAIEGPRGDRVRSVFEPLGGMVDAVGGDREIRPGVAMVESFGHTPGHMSVELRSEGRRAVLGGDVTHHPLQAAYPEWNMAADYDRALAVRSRRLLYEGLAADDGLLGAGHFPRPGFGSVVVDEGVRVFVPAQVSEL